MPRVVQRMRNIRPVRVAFVESNRHLRALDQREVKAVHVIPRPHTDVEKILPKGNSQ